MKVTLKSVTPDAEKTIVEIARVSSKREDKSADADRLISYLIKNKHWSPFEHAFMTVEIVTSKFVSIQYLRHRSFTFQEFSQRYALVENFEDINIRMQADKNRQSSTDDFDPHIKYGVQRDVHDRRIYSKASVAIGDLLDEIKLCYNALIDAGVAKECARAILPMSTQTKLFMTGSIRSWIHLIQLRDDPHAQKEAQEVARAIKEIFNQQFPIVSKALSWL